LLPLVGLSSGLSLQDHASAVSSDPEGQAPKTRLHFPDAEGLEKDEESEHIVRKWVDPTDDVVIAPAGEVWKDPPMYEHNLHNPNTRKPQAPREVHEIGDERDFPNITQFKKVHRALAIYSEFWHAACQASKKIMGCDPIFEMMQKLKLEVRDGMQKQNHQKLENIWRMQNFILRLATVSDEMPFEEFWMILNKRDWREITPRSLMEVGYNPLVAYGLRDEQLDLMFEIADHDKSGGVSHDEFQHFVMALTEATWTPLNPARLHKDDLNRIAIETWTGGYRDVPQRQHNWREYFVR